MGVGLGVEAGVAVLDRRAVPNLRCRVRGVGDVLHHVPRPVVTAGEERRYEPGDVLVREGEPADDLRLLLRGTATISIAGLDVGHLATGDWIGEPELCGTEGRSATVTATTTTDCLVVPIDAVRHALDAAPAFTGRLRHALVATMRRSQAALAELACDPARLLRALLDRQRSPDPVTAETARRRTAALRDLVASLEQATAPDPLRDLSAAERTVAELVAEGLSNAAVAARLGVSRHTVDTHVKHAYAKLGVRSRVALARLVLGGTAAIP